MINPKVISRIIANTDIKTKLRLAKVIPKLGKADEITRCMLCPNMCLHVCPVFDAERRLTVSPSVKARLGYFSQDYTYEAVYHCLPCDACKSACPMEISVNDNLRNIRAGFDTEIARKAAERIERDLFKNLRKTETEKREGKILYFPGCRTLENGLFTKTVEVLEKLKIDFAVDDLLCCGMPYYELGLFEKFKSAINEVKRLVSKYEGVVSNCPHCVAIMRESGIRAAHIISILQPVKVGGDLSYHDPCIMARKLDVTQEPRKLLEEMGCAIHEPAFSGKDTHCCGYGGVYKFIAPDYAEVVAKNRRDHFEYEIVTACPSCKTALKAIDFVELIGERL
ncbi:MULTISPECIES: (Fe-S)-binding protein [unclassified Archaeoglobus]|uniref:(Fe-S)-binding protein n=1 Tax=unclassified Archaeoglobus TaxID=2643606 RepID=UPI0025BD640B|nr:MULTISPECIES: (Fe-S)-binding protein [unclassified Archaeoglobus]